MTAGDVIKIEALVIQAQEQSQKIERGLKFIKKLKKTEQLMELNAIEIEAKEFQKLILKIQKLKGQLGRKSPEHIRLLSEVELIEDMEVDLYLEFQKVRKNILGLSDGSGAGGGNSKGVMMAAALGMKIGEQGVKRTEEILATLREANNLMDNMQGDILEQRKKLFRIKDQVKNAQSLTNRGKEALKYFSDQATKDVCIKVLVGLIAFMIICMGGLTYQISQERDMIQLSPKEAAEENLENMGLTIDDKGRVQIDPDLEANDEDGYMDEGNMEQKKKAEAVKESYEKEKQESIEDSKKKGEDKISEDDINKIAKEKEGEDSMDRRMERELKTRFFEKNRKVLKNLKIS